MAGHPPADGMDPIEVAGEKDFEGGSVPGPRGPGQVLVAGLHSSSQLGLLLGRDLDLGDLEAVTAFGLGE